MPFSEIIRKAEIGQAENCAICKREFREEPELHSVTSLHLVLTEVKGKLKYLVTDAPSGHEQLMVKSLNLGVYLPNGEAKKHDGVWLDKDCHVELHRSALFEAQLMYVGFKGKIAPPGLLRKMLSDFMERGKPIIYNRVNDDNGRRILKINFIYRS